MTTQTIETVALAKLAKAGRRFGVSVLADKDGWTVCVHDQAGEYVLLDQAGKVAAVFEALEAVEQHLRSLGIVRFEVDGRIDRDSDGPVYDAWFRAGYLGGYMRYRVALRHSEEGYSVSVPALPGCHSQGATEEEAIDNIKIAIVEYLSVLEEQFHDMDVREVEVTA